MKTLFDLRVKQDDDLYGAIEKLYAEPLNVVSFDAQSITACIGCWNCWLKTPGRCVMKDQMAEHYHDYVNSDTVILLMSTAQGFIDHQAKAFFDRTIPHYHPYIEIIGGECHHVARYASYPDMVFFFDREGLTSREEQVIENYLARCAYQFKSHAFRIVEDGDLHLQPLDPRSPSRGALPFASVEQMDKLVIYNGSPRRSGSNSALILRKVSEVLGDRVEIRDLKAKDQWELWAESFIEEEHVLFFMPLYIHAMPSHVMAFIEKLRPSRGSISFFIQSGFPEGGHSHYLEAYFEQLAPRLGRTYLGCAIKGGVEGMQMRPVKAQDKMITSMAQVVEALVNEGKFNPADIRRLAMPVQLGRALTVLFTLLARVGLLNYFWDKQLKENSAYEKRFDHPFAADSSQTV